MFSFPLPLGRAPVLVQCGLGRHGRAGAPTVERWRLPDLWCLHFYGYHARLEIGDETFEIVPDSVSLAPPTTLLTYSFEDQVEHFYAHFSLESAPNFSSARGKYWFGPEELAPDFARQMQRLIGAAQQPRAHPMRAPVALWELLWQLAQASPPDPLADAVHPALQRAITLIESRLESEILIAQLAREVGLSHNHLTRLFVAQCGQTAIGYVRARRTQRATHLLRRSTLPIKTIAAQVGISNLVQFNHLMRSQTGYSPRAIRAGEMPEATPLDVQNP